MPDFAPSSAPPDQWGELCSGNNLFFSSTAWHGLLGSAFAAPTTYWWDESRQAGAAVTAFPAGPFRVGYLGFPVGGLVGGGAADIDVLLRDIGAASGQRTVALRVPVSAFGATVALDLPCAETPETAIVDLQSWSAADASTNHRRDIKKALRSGVEIVDATSAQHASDIHSIYRETLRRHGGGLRYNSAYFTALVDLAANTASAKVMIAMHDGRIAGFLVVTLHADTGYYLHGGMRRDCRQVRPSALLMHEAIEWAKVAGCRSFNLMSSPPEQASLVRYKEKWGGETRQHRTHTLRLSNTYHLFRAAEWLYRLVR